MKKAIMLTLCLVTLLIVACQNAGQAVSTSESPFCTTCKTETVTTFIKGLNHTKYKCPKCETLREYDDYGAEIIHTCTNCKRALEQCPICIKRGE